MAKKILFVVHTLVIVALLLSTSCKKKSADITGEDWGDPEYGGTITIRAEMIDVITDPMDPRSAQFGMWMEGLFGDNMTIDRREFSYQSSFVPMKYQKPWMAESYKIDNPSTITVKIRKGIKWQNKPPVNGRDFKADDVIYSYDRVFGTGSFKTPDPFFINFLSAIDKVVKIDDYTVQFKLKFPSAMAIYQITRPFLQFGMLAKEWVALGPLNTGPPPGPPKGGPPKGPPGPPPGPSGPLGDWRNVAGTGAYILTDFVPGTSITCDKNPDYWGYDDNNPENKLPYADKIRVLAIPDMATAIAALKTGKIDMIADDRSHVSIQEAQSLAKTNPNIKQYWWPGRQEGVIFKHNTKPFDDIRVRKAMQLAIDREGIAKNFYRSIVDGKPSGLLLPFIGEDWVIPYDEWPKSLREEYSYNPDKAKKLLKDAGYPNGFKTEILAATVDDMELLQILKSQFKQIGIDMKIDGRDMMTQRFMVNSGTYSQTVYGATGGFAQNPSDALTTFYSKKHERAGLIVDPDYDIFVEKISAAKTEKEAQKIFKEADMYALKQHWAAIVCPAITAQLYQPWIKGWKGEHFWSVWTWQYFAQMWIDQDMKKEMGF